MQTIRLILGFVVSPLVPSLLTYVYMIATMSMPHPVVTISMLGNGFVRVAYVVALLAGIPTYYLFLKKHLDRWWHFAAGGAALGCVPTICLTTYDLLTDGNSWFELIMLAIGIPYGAVAGFAFWMISVRKSAVRSEV